MNNTRTLAIAAIFMAATLVVGVSTIAATSAAFAYKKGGDDRKDKGRDNGSKDGNTVTIQANKQRGSVSGFDNDLEQEAQNVICTHPSATCSQEGSEAPVASNDNVGSNSDKDPHSGDKISIW
jgi:hypothetical protein